MELIHGPDPMNLKLNNRTGQDRKFQQLDQARRQQLEKDNNEQTGLMVEGD